MFFPSVFYLDYFEMAATSQTAKMFTHGKELGK
jgi:hypothetical protein